MKMNRISVILGGLLWVLLTNENAFAFYNPSTGRWLSRDPIGEAGFNLNCTTKKTNTICKSRQQCAISCPDRKIGNDKLHGDTDELNLYAFVKNAPIHAIDHLGLRGKLCVSATCGKERLKNFRYIPEDDCKLLPIEPGKCYDVDAVYAPGIAVKVRDSGTLTITCHCRFGPSTPEYEFKKPQYECTGFFQCVEWRAGEPGPPVDNWPCGGRNPTWPPYTDSPPQ